MQSVRRVCPWLTEAVQGGPRKKSASGSHTVSILKIRTLAECIVDFSFPFSLHESSVVLLTCIKCEPGVSSRQSSVSSVLRSAAAGKSSKSGVVPDDGIVLIARRVRGSPWGERRCQPEDCLGSRRVGRSNC